MSEWHRMISSEWGKQGIIGKQGITQRSFPVCVRHVNNLWEWKKYNGPNTRPINGIRVQYQLQLATIINTLKYTCLYGWARETEKKDSTTKNEWIWKVRVLFWKKWTGPWKRFSPNEREWYEIICSLDNTLSVYCQTSVAVDGVFGQWKWSVCQLALTSWLADDLNLMTRDFIKNLNIIKWLFPTSPDGLWSPR